MIYVGHVGAINIQGLRQHMPRFVPQDPLLIPAGETEEGPRKTNRAFPVPRVCMESPFPAVVSIGPGAHVQARRKSYFGQGIKWIHRRPCPKARSV